MIRRIRSSREKKKSLIFINLRVCLSVVVVDLIKLIFYDKKKKTKN